MLVNEAVLSVLGKEAKVSSSMVEDGVYALSWEDVQLSING
jgi:hypothetical protein